MGQARPSLLLPIAQWVPGWGPADMEGRAPTAGQALSQPLPASVRPHPAGPLSTLALESVGTRQLGLSSRLASSQAPGDLLREEGAAETEGRVAACPGSASARAWAARLRKGSPAPWVSP